MKLTSLKIYETLTYSEVKNIPNLTKAMNRHIDMSKTVDDVRNMARNGVDGSVDDIMAFELGLPVDGFVPVYGQKKKVKRKKKGEKGRVKTSKYRGVVLTSCGKYMAQISVLGVKKHLGRFIKEDEAAIAYNKMDETMGRK